MAAQPLGAEVPHDHPELQRAEPPPELDAGVHQILHARVPFARLEVLGRQRERLAEHIHPPAIEHAQVERREQPLVRVDHDRVGLLRRRAGSIRPGHHRGDAGISGVDVQPDVLARADRGDLSTGSTLVVDVVPTVATTAIGMIPAARSAAMAFASSSGRMRNSSSAGIRVSASWPRPSRITALSMEECACSPQ